MVRWLHDSAMKDVSFKELYESKYFEKFPSTDEFAKMPEKSLGRVLHRHLTENNLNLEWTDLDTEAFYKLIETPAGYLGWRALKQHDVYHAVLGLGTNAVDEFALAGFQLAQFQSPYHMALHASGMLHVTFYAPEKIPELLEKNYHFYGLGKQARFFPGFQFESHWETHIDEVRDLLGV